MQAADLDGGPADPPGLSCGAALSSWPPWPGELNLGPELLSGPSRCWIRARALRGPQKRITESVSHRFALPKLTAQIETATGLCEGINPSPKMTRDRARPRPATPATHDTYRADILLPTTRTRAPTAGTTATTPAPEAEPTSTHLKSEYQRHDTSAFLARARTPRHGHRIQELRDRAHAVERMQTDLRLFTLLDDHAPDLREAPHAV